jgi:hypothetical protein
MKANKKRVYDYPAKTDGSRLAAKARAECNHLSEQERDTLLEGALKLAYGKIQEQKVGSGH